MTTKEAIFFLIGNALGAGLATWIAWDYIGVIKADVRNIIAMGRADADRIRSVYRGIVHPGLTATIQHGADSVTLVSNKGDVPVEYTVNPVAPAPDADFDTH